MIKLRVKATPRLQSELRAAFKDVVDLHIKVKAQPESPPQKHFAWRFLARFRQAFHL